MTGTSTDVVLSRLARPYEPTRVVAALLGLPARVARQLVGASVATSPEAEALLDAMPQIVRSLAIATTDRPERCYGELRGPVLWSETMSARSASAGDPGLFVCSTTTKAYDTDENRVLKAALATVRRAGSDADHGPESQHPDLIKRARQNGHRAYHLLEHRTLADVPVTKLSGRGIRRTRAGSRRATYRPAIDLLLRAGDPLRAADLDEHVDPATRQQVDVLAAALEGLEARGVDAPLRSAHGQLLCGPVLYDHLAGVSIDGHLVIEVGGVGPALDRIASSAAR